jgi:hypothetical protein
MPADRIHQLVAERREAESKAGRAAVRGRTAEYEYWRDRAMELRGMERRASPQQQKRDREQKIAELKRDKAKLRLEHRIRRAESWLVTLRRVNQALLSREFPCADGDWDQALKNEKEMNRIEERGVQLTLKILRQETHVKALKWSYEHQFGRDKRGK